MSDFPAPIVLNTTVPSNLAVTDDLDLLDVFGERVVTVSTVIDELRHGIEDGYAHLDRAIGAVEVIDAEGKPGDDLADLDPGETHALHAARSLGGTIATDDPPARRRANDLNITVTGSIRVLTLAVEQDRLTIDEADEKLARWIEAGYFSPVESVADVL